MGPSVEISADESSSTSYMIDLQQEVFVEADRSINCAVYPTEQHERYEECDTEFVRKSLGPDIVPVWATTENISKATGPINGTCPKITNLAAGLTMSSCKLPCTTTKGAIKLNSKDPYQSTILAVAFTKTLKITTTDFVPFSLAESLASLGGSLGLWLGLGLLQLGQEGVRGLGVLLQAAQGQGAETE